MFSVRIIRK